MVICGLYQLSTPWCINIDLILTIIAAFLAISIFALCIFKLIAFLGNYSISVRVWLRETKLHPAVWALKTHLSLTTFPYEL